MDGSGVPDVWQCLACTLVNPMVNTICEVCESSRPLAFGAAQAATPQAPTLRLQFDEQPAHQHVQEPQPKQAVNVSGRTEAHNNSTGTAPQIGLTLEQRKEREKEMTVKRQKKEEERQKIIRQAEADRQAHIAMSTPPSEVPPRAAAADQGLGTLAQRPEPKFVKLQVRCPHWSRNIVFTCFAPNNTLGDVRKCIREELVKGIAGTGDGRINSDDDASARVPLEETICLVESVPPRRRFTTAEDMQQTLRDAGLCPSSTLIAEAPPVEVSRNEVATAAQEVPVPNPDGVPTGSRAAATEDNPEDEEDQEDDNEQEESEGDDDLDYMGGTRPPASGSGTGTFATGRGLIGRPFPRGGPPQFGRGRGRGRFAVDTPEFPESGGQVLGSSADGIATASTPSGLGTATTNPSIGSTSEQQAAARAARLAALERRGASDQAQRDKALAPPEQSAAQKKELPHKEEGRVKGQMGGNVDKATRAKEREKILQQMQEDRDSYLERKGAVPAATVAASRAAEQSSGVRLQIRCPASGRSVTTRAFEASAPLREVYEFAVKELGSGSDSSSALMLGYPPWTDFAHPETRSESLAELGLAPAATLLLKPPPQSAEAQEDVAHEVVQEPARSEYKCPGGHVMTAHTAEEEGWCDMCSATLPIGTNLYQCRDCDYFQCQECSAKQH